MIRDPNALNGMNGIVVGCKVVREDGSSLREEGRVTYPVGEWIEVGGDGSYVSITAGLLAGGMGPLLIYLECREPTGLGNPPSGIVCFRRVRRLAEPAPSRISSKLRAELAYYAPGLPLERRLSLVSHMPSPLGLIAFPNREERP